MLEFNAKKSNYKVYRGVFMYKSFTFIPAFTPDIEKDSLAELIKVFDIIEQLENADDRKEDLIDYYEKFSDVPVEVSVRELLHYFKRVGYIPNIDERDLVADIENVSDEVNVIKLQEFFNTFTTGETARDILGLSEFKKTFRYNKLTMLDVLEILSKEYLTETGSKITATVLGDLIYVVLDTKKTDRFQVDNLKLNN
jgi:hypothetical protein